MAFAQAPHPGTMPTPSGRPRRPMWHWLLLAVVALFGLLIVAVFAIFIAFQVLNRGNPANTLDDFYTSLESKDCELFMESTTEDFQEATGFTSCEIFDAELGEVSEVDYQVDERINRQGYAIFEVTETYSDGGEEFEVEMRYFVRRIDGQWDLAGFEPIDEGTEPIT